MKRMGKRVTSLALALCMLAGLLVLAPVEALAAGDYNDADVAAVNAMIENNGLNATKDDPVGWSFATWNSDTPKQITELNLESRSLTDAVNITGLTELTFLNLKNNAITSLTGLGDATKLETLVLELNQLSSIDVSANTQLTALNLASNQLRELSVTGLAALRELAFDGNSIASIDLSTNNNLKYLNCYRNQLTALDVSNLIQLLELRCRYNQITELDVSNCPALKVLELGQNRLTSLDVRNNPELTRLALQSNQISSLDLSQNTKLRELMCANGKGTKLTALDLSANTELRHLHCQNNALTTLDLSASSALETLNCYDNNMTTLTLATGTELTWLDCARGNNLSGIPDLGTYTKTNFVYFGNEDITTLGIPANTDKYVVVVKCPLGDDEYDIRNYRFGEVKSLELEGYDDLESWTIDPLPDNVDLTDNPIEFPLTQGITTVTPIYRAITTTAPSITTTSLPKGTVGSAYSQIIAATGTAPVTFTLESGTLPDGLTLSTTGLLSGTPTAEGSFDFTVKATNSAGNDTQTFTLVIESSGGNDNGNGGGGGGGTTTTTPPASNVTTESGTSTVTLTPKTTTSGNSTNAALSENQISAAVEAAEKAAQESGTEAAVRVEIETKSDTDIKAILPTTALDAIAKSEADTLIISGAIGEVALDGDTLASLADRAKGSTVSIEIDHADPIADLTETQRETVGDRPVYDISITSGGEEIHALGGTATVTLPYTLRPGEDPQNIVVYYVYSWQSGGHYETRLERMHTRYDAATETITFLTSHFSTYVIGYWKNPFADVATGAWYYDDVAFAAVNSIMNGTADASFTPDGTMTRGMVVTVLHRLAGEPAADGTRFDDVSVGSYYDKAILWAAENGIVTGLGDNLFAPDAQMTRQDFAVVLTRYMSYAKLNPATTQQYLIFADEADIADYAKSAIQTLCKLGVMQGTGDGVNPQDSATRAEAAAMLHRFISATV